MKITELKFKRYWELLYFITLSGINARYKQTVLGILWIVFRPFFMMLAFTVVFSMLARFPSDGMPYPIFSYVALLPWVFFSSSLNSAMSSLVSNSNLIKQIYFPREIFPVSAVLSGLFDFFVSSLIFIGMLFFYKIKITLTIMYLIPLLIMIIFLALGLSLFFSALNIYYRDVSQAMSFALQLLLFSVPVVYSVNVVPLQYKFFYMLNPLAFIIDGFRKVVLENKPLDICFMSISSVIIGVIFVFSYFYFKKVEMKFADIV